MSNLEAINLDHSQIVLKVKLEPRNFKAEQKLFQDGFYYKILEISKTKKVPRLRNTKGYCLLVKSLSTPVTRWVSLDNDPDYVIIETGV